MAVVADRVIVELEAKLDRYDANVRRAEQTFAKATGGIEKNAGLVTKATGAMGAALAGISAGVAAREFLRLADASKSIDAQLRLATKSIGTFNQAQADAERIASVTRNGLTETASLYGNLLRATQTLGGTQAQASRATETFSKALKIGGADTQAAASATLQFGQALASGVLRGDEFNSIAEASPRILQLLADAIGKPAGELRALAADGKLTSDILFKALTDRRFTAGIDDEFKTLPVTFGEAMQAVENAATITIGAFDRGGEFSTAIANFFTQGADGFAGLGESAEQFGADTRAVIAGLANVFDPLGVSGNAVFDALGVKIFSVSEQIRSLLGSIDKVYNFYADADNIGTRIENSIKRGLNRAIDRAGGGEKFKETPLIQRRDSAGDFDRGMRRSSARSRLNSSVRRLEGNGFIVPRNADGTVDEANIRRRPVAPTPPRPAKAGPKGKKGPKGPSAETLANRAEAAAQKELRNDESYEKEKADLNRDLLRARRATVTAADQIAAFELQEIEAARVRQNASYDAEVSQKKLTAARAEELKALNNAVAAEQAKAVRLEETERKARDALALAQGDLNNQTDLLDAQAALTDSVGERRDISLRLLDLAKQEEKIRLEAIVASTQASEAEKEIARRRLAVLDKLYGAKAEAVKQGSEGKLDGYRRDLGNPDRSRNEVEGAVISELEGVRDSISSAVQKTLGIKNPILAALLNSFIEQQLIKPLLDSVSKGGSAGGILGSVFRSVGSLFKGGKRASGGHVNAGTIYQINDGGGTEGFQPAGSGKIIPLGQMNRAGGGGGTSVYQSFTLDARYGITTPELLRHVNEVATKKASQAGGAAFDAGQRALPGRLERYQKLGN